MNDLTSGPAGPLLCQHTYLMADGLYSSFAEVLSVCQSFKDDLAAILDPESGFAPRMRELCEQQ
jgi:hypothetical protein